MAELRPYVLEGPTRAEALLSNHPPNPNVDWPKPHGPFETAEQAKEIARQINEQKGASNA